jgi:dienelactone hydrolase
MEKIAFDAAYPNERVLAYLYLPLNAEPPFQIVVYFPGAGSLYVPSHDHEWSQYVSFLVRSGRAVVFPIYRGTYERSMERASGDRARRDRVINWRLDLGRTIDYLETREDIDIGRLAFYGFSMGATHGPIFTAIDKRFKAAVLLAGGLYSNQRLPEIDTFNFAPRSTLPTIMLNGRHDFYFPLESSQKPLFQLLGTPPEHKRHVLFDMSHVPPRNSMVKESLSWLDEYLGPVELVRLQSEP